MTPQAVQQLEQMYGNAHAVVAVGVFENVVGALVSVVEAPCRDGGAVVFWLVGCPGVLHPYSM